MILLAERGQAHFPDDETTHPEPLVNIESRSIKESDSIKQSRGPEGGLAPTLV